MTKPVRFLLSICSIPASAVRFLPAGLRGPLRPLQRLRVARQPQRKTAAARISPAGRREREKLAGDRLRLLGLSRGFHADARSFETRSADADCRTARRARGSGRDSGGLSGSGFDRGNYTDICLRAAARVPAFPTSDPICEAVDWRYLRSRDSASWRCDYDGDREAARAFREEDRLAGVLRFRRRSGL